MKKQVGIIGWRGIVGSTLLDRIKSEKNHKNIDLHLFTTSQVNKPCPKSIPTKNSLLKDAYNLKQLLKMDIIITCQGSTYSNKIKPQLQREHWNGFWVDASSHYRMSTDSIIVLDPINKDLIHKSIEDGIKNFIGGNCTVSLLTLAIHGLLKYNKVEWINVMSYQAVSGAGSKALEELLLQSKILTSEIKKTKLNNWASSLSTIKLPTKNLKVPLAYNVLPWIDSNVGTGQTKEEWKAGVELNKILNNSNISTKIDGICVRVPTLRSHSQAVHINLKQKITLKEIIYILSMSNKWVDIIDNEKDETLQSLTPLSILETLTIPIGRLKKTQLNNNSIHAFTSGDQLLWGAAEPLRRILSILTQKD